MPETTDKTVHILLLDDHALFRESVGRLLAAEPGFDVAAHCGTIEEALHFLKQKSIDVVLLDFDLGAHDGREFATGRGTRIQGKDSGRDCRRGSAGCSGIDPLWNFRGFPET